MSNWFRSFDQDYIIETVAGLSTYHQSLSLKIVLNNHKYFKCLVIIIQIFTENKNHNSKMLTHFPINIYY